MNLLLDTHVVLWAFADPARLRPDVREAIVDPRNAVHISAASIWEIEIKRAIGRLTAPDGIAELCLTRGFDPLDITFQHATVAGTLPAHHADPFDRMLVAQAIVDDLSVVTSDRAFAAYDVPTIAAD